MLNLPVTFYNILSKKHFKENMAIISGHQFNLYSFLSHLRQYHGNENFLFYLIDVYKIL